MQTRTSIEEPPDNGKNRADTNQYTCGNDYLSDLKSRFPQVNFSLTDLRDAADLEKNTMARIGEYDDVAISWNTLEKFAHDPALAARMETTLQQFLVNKQFDLDILAANGATPLGRRMLVDINGEASFWGITSDMLENVDTISKDGHSASNLDDTVFAGKIGYDEADGQKLTTQPNPNETKENGLEEQPDLLTLPIYKTHGNTRKSEYSITGEKITNTHLNIKV